MAQDNINLKITIDKEYKNKYAKDLQVGQYVYLRYDNPGEQIGRVSRLTEDGIYLVVIKPTLYLDIIFIEYARLLDTPKVVVNHTDIVFHKREAVVKNLSIGTYSVLAVNGKTMRGYVKEILSDSLVLICDEEIVCIPIVMISDKTCTDSKMLQWCKDNKPTGADVFSDEELVDLMRDAFIESLLQERNLK